MKMRLKLYLFLNRLHFKIIRLLIGREQFCTQCDGPYGGWLLQYGGHWDTCPNRVEYRAKKI